MKNILTKITLATVFLIFGLTLHGQVGIKDDQSAADPSAMLDIQSTSKGFLTPRMTEFERNSISNPATGLLVYQTDKASGFYYNEGTPASPDWRSIGNEKSENDIIDSRIPIDSVALFGSVNGTQTLYHISEPGSYYLTHNINLAESGLNNANRKGIYITSSNVTLDLNGYSILGDLPPLIGDPDVDDYPIATPSSSEGIDVFGQLENITIKNGFIANWQGDGIEALFLDNSIFQDLHVSNVRGKGIVSDNHNLFIECSAYFCGDDGLEGDISTNFIRCNASANDGDGINGSTSSQFINCNAYKNQQEGIFASGSGCLVLGCDVSDNLEYGIFTLSMSAVLKCNAYDNILDGIRVSTSSLVQDCYSGENHGNGIYTTGNNCRIINNVLQNNDLSGIHTDNTGILIQDNYACDNDVYGIWVESIDCLIIRNFAAGNVNQYQINSGSSYGPIVDVNNDGDISNVQESDHPFVNFTF